VYWLSGKMLATTAESNWKKNILAYSAKYPKAMFELNNP
jgi:hypothetical protein